jgi:protocatechuate 3,4-dioxygenase beta subunit/thiol-disulfide isomerase/thioredoxin
MKNFTFITMVACILALNTLMVHSQTIHEPNTNSVCLLENFHLKLPPTDEVNSIFSEDFSSGTFPPAGWTIVGDGQTNWSAQNTSSAGGTPPEAVFYYEPIFMGNSRLVTSTISTSGYTSLLLSFKHRLDDAGGPGNYTLFVETSSDGGTTWNEVWSLLDPGSTVGPEIKYLIIDNDDVGSDNFQIAFTFDGDSDDLNLWNIDDVMVEEALQYDAKAVNILIPSQVAADDVVIPSGIVQNMGYEAITFDVNFTIEEQGGASVYNEDISVTNLAPFESQSLVFPDWVPDEGTYDCMLTTNLAGDANPDNNQVNKTIEAITGAFDFKPLYEEFTSSTCGPCAYANPILDAVLFANPETHSLIKYQVNWPGNGDPYYTEEVEVRRDYYSVFGVPDLFINGNQFPPGDMTQAVYNLSQGLITGMSIAVTAEIDDDYNLTVNANIDVSYNYDAGLKAHIVVVEKETVGNVGTNGETEFYNVMLKMLPNAGGTTLPALTPGNTESIFQLYPMDLTFMEEPDDLAIIVFVQDDIDKSIIQSEQIDVEGTFEAYEVTFIVSDADGNPVNNAEIFLESQGYQYTNSTGQTVFEVVFPGNYDYEVTAVGLLGTSGSLEVVDQDVTENVTLEIPDYYFFEPFDTGIPASWTSHVTSPDMVYWYNGEVLLFDQTPETYPIMLVSPEINIEPVITLYFDAGQQSNSPTLLFGTVSDPDDPSTFVLYETLSPGDDMETYSIDLTQITSTDVYFAWQLQESQGSWVVIDNVIIYAESSDSYSVTFNVADSEGNGVENAEVYVSGQGSLITNEYGEVIFQNVYPGSYNYNVVAETLIPYEGNITIVDEDVTENVVLEDYFIYEGFDTEIPNDWTVHYTYPDNLYWYNDWVTFFNQTGNANPLILVTPLLYLEGLTSVIIEIGSGTYNPDLVVGTLSDPDDPDSFTPLETFPISGTWGFITVDLTNYTGTDSYLGFKLEGVPFSYFFISNIGFTGSMNTSIFEDNFESYNAGEQLACQNPDDWTTWSNDPCSAEDPYIKTDQAYSGNNSVEITGTNDLVKVIENYTSGYYSISFKMYVPTGHDGYFNTLQEFNGTNSQWGMQVYFDAGGAGSIDGGGTAAATFSFNYDEWMDIVVKVDLNADWAEFYHNNYYIHGWVWSSGTGGTGTLNQLGGSNFYAWEGANGSPLYYFDDYKIEEAIALDAPTNLVATVIDDNDIELTWEAPSKDFIGYNIFRDEDVIAEEITETNYTDFDLLPGTYTYDVKAVYDEGISAGAGPADATIEGGTDRDIVILEIGTGTWCTFCPGAAMGADDLVENGHAVGIIEYHGGDDYETSESGARLDDYYGITGYPTAWFDGIITHVGGNSSISMYETYLGYYEQRIDKVSLFTLDAEVVNVGGTSWEVMVDAEMIYPYPGSDVVLQAVLIESHIPENWLNQTEVNFVCRDMLPDQFGSEMDFVTNPMQSITLDLELPAAYEINNCEVVVFLQDNDTKEILQGTKAGLYVSIDEPQAARNIEIFPNPATDKIMIKSTSSIQQIEMYNQVGQLVKQSNTNASIVNLNVAEFDSGIYFVKVISHDQIITRKLVVE